MISQVGTLLSWLIFLSAFLFSNEALFSINTDTFGVMAFSIPLLVVVIARSLDGLTGGNISVANAYLSDITTEGDRRKAFGQMSSSMSLGFIVGPSVAGLLASVDNGNLITIIVTAFISLLGLLAIIYLLPETPIKKEVYSCQEAKLKKAFGFEYRECYDLDQKSTNWQTVINQKGATLMIVLFFVIFLAFNLFYATFSMYSSTTLEWSAQRVGIFFTLLSGVMIIGQGPVLTRLSTRYSEIQLFTLGALIMGLSFFFMTSQQESTLYLAAVFYGLGNGIMWPSYQAMLSKTGSQEKQGSLQGIANGTGSLAGIIGLTFGGFLLSVLSGKIYMISAILLLGIFLVGVFYMVKSLRRKL